MKIMKFNSGPQPFVDDDNSGFGGDDTGFNLTGSIISNEIKQDGNLEKMTNVDGDKQAIIRTVKLERSTFDVQLGLNSYDRKVTFQRVRVCVNELIDISASFPGFGQSTSITGRIHFDSTLDFLDDRALSTKALPDEKLRFSIHLDEDDDYEDLFPEPILSGSYEFSGPTETVSGVFQVNPSWIKPFDGIQLDTTSFPESVKLTEGDLSLDGRFTGIVCGGPSYLSHLFTENVDGYDLRFDLVKVKFGIHLNTEKGLCLKSHS